MISHFKHKKIPRNFVDNSTRNPAAGGGDGGGPGAGLLPAVGRAHDVPLPGAGPRLPRPLPPRRRQPGGQDHHGHPQQVAAATNVYILGWVRTEGYWMNYLMLLCLCVQVAGGCCPGRHGPAARLRHDGASLGRGAERSGAAAGRPVRVRARLRGLSPGEV